MGEITYKDINSGGNWAFIGGKSLVDNSDVCVAEATGAGGVGSQILQQGLEVGIQLHNKNSLA